MRKKTKRRIAAIVGCVVGLPSLTGFVWVNILIAMWQLPVTHSTTETTLWAIAFVADISGMGTGAALLAYALGMDSEPIFRLRDWW